MARQTKERAEQTREAIVDAAEAVFFRDGLAKASLDMIAAAAGVTRGAVYWHFKDKLDVFLAVESRVRLPQQEILGVLGNSPQHLKLALLEDATVRAFQEYDDGTETARKKYVQMVVLLLRCDYVGELKPALDRQNEIFNYFARELQSLFREAGKQREPALWPPDIAAQIYYTLVHGAMLRWLRHPADYSLKREGVAAVQALLAAIRDDWGLPAPA